MKVGKKMKVGEKIYVEKLQPNNKFNQRIEKIHKGKHSNETK